MAIPVVSGFGGQAGEGPLLEAGTVEVEQIGEAVDSVEWVGAVTSAANLFLLGGVVLGPMLFGGLASLQNYSIAFGGLAGCVFIVSAITAARKPTFTSD